MNRMIIRDAFPNDLDAIANCVSAAFDNEGEVVLVQQLRADNDVVIELVREELVQRLRRVLENVEETHGLAPFSVLSPRERS